MPKPPYHVEARDADEFHRSGTTLESSKPRETDMPLMPTSAAPNDPRDVRPERDKQKSEDYGDGTLPNKQKENTKWERREEVKSAHFNHASRCGA